MTWADESQAWSAILSALIALISVPLVVISLRQAASAFLMQKRATDATNVLALFERLDHHWCRYRLSIDTDVVVFEFGQLISYYELSCTLFRYRAFNTVLANILHQHLHDVLVMMRENEDFKSRFDELRGATDNYENIDWLCAQPRPIMVEADMLSMGLQRIYSHKLARVLN